ncbi:response regulator [Agrobacterium larrymoorei]|nr:response regulator [Agrobacterium larrymoorei]
MDGTGRHLTVFRRATYQNGKVMLQAIILVIEDEPIIRMTVAEDLLSEGFSVVEASNAHEALAILESGEKITAIFSDIDMPGTLNGLQLAWIVRERWPPVHLFLTSGHKRPRVDELPEQACFIPKPYLHKAVIGALRNTLGTG